MAGTKIYDQYRKGTVYCDEKNILCVVCGGDASVASAGDGISCNSLSVVGGKTYIYAAGDTDSDGNGRGAYIEGDESAISVSGSTVLLTGGEAALKFEKSSETNPYSGTLPNASFKGNTAYDTFTSMSDVNYKSQKVSDMADQFFECAYGGNGVKSVAAVFACEKKTSGCAEEQKLYALCLGLHLIYARVSVATQGGVRLQIHFLSVSVLCL